MYIDVRPKHASFSIYLRSLICVDVGDLYDIYIIPTFTGVLAITITQTHLHLTKALICAAGSIISVHFQSSLHYKRRKVFSSLWGNI